MFFPSTFVSNIWEAFSEEWTQRGQEDVWKGLPDWWTAPSSHIIKEKPELHWNWQSLASRRPLQRNENFALCLFPQHGLCLGSFLCCSTLKWSKHNRDLRSATEAPNVDHDCRRWSSTCFWTPSSTSWQQRHQHEPVGTETDSEVQLIYIVSNCHVDICCTVNIWKRVEHDTLKCTTR